MKKLRNQTVMKNRLRYISRVVLYLLAGCIFLLNIYVNKTMPRGEIFYTGDVVCDYDGRGQCTEDTYEEMRGLDNPIWAKIIRKYGLLIIITSCVMAGYYRPLSKPDKHVVNKWGE